MCLGFVFFKWRSGDKKLEQRTKSKANKQKEKPAGKSRK